jgi:hypothetical protein
MDADRTELNNVIDAHSDIAAKMETAWNDWLKRAFVDEWTGPDHTNWGQDIKPDSRAQKPK